MYDGFLKFQIPRAVAAGICECEWIQLSGPKLSKQKTLIVLITSRKETEAIAFQVGGGKISGGND